MATRQVKKPQANETTVFGPRSAGTLMTLDEFDKAEFKPGWRYEVIRGVLVVTPIPLEGEVDPNEELGHLLRTYAERHAQGKVLDCTLPERNIRTGRNNRKAARVIWAGLGRLPRTEGKPRERDVPTILVEFVSAGRRNRQRDDVTKRAEYLKLGVREYWIIDRFQRMLTALRNRDGYWEETVVAEDQTYQTDILPGFELPLARLLTLADRWRR